MATSSGRGSGHSPANLTKNLKGIDFPADKQDLLKQAQQHHAEKVVIDEIQRIPDLLNEVHRLIESRRLRFVLTGSSARKLRRRGVNLLAGRALLRSLHPFMAAELGSRFHLELALAQGLVPLVWSSPEPEEVLKAYVSLYLKEEVQMEGLVRRFESFARFLEAVSFSHASSFQYRSTASSRRNLRRTDGRPSAPLRSLMATRRPVPPWPWAS